ncbi:DUF2399 domain-containing protein [Streptomyces sp. NPDC059378]|uniref:DUF2399 domain-containing protein n=1 Tax=Streptomyces sp. NPDC059378 TaxID=3346815 RepID=UPI00367DFFFC
MAGDLHPPAPPLPREPDAIAALSQVGWSVAVRADFDQAGLAHGRALLNAAPAAIPWRMNTTDYLATAPEGTDTLHLQDEDAPGDEHVVPTMRKHSVPAYEEDRLAALPPTSSPEYQARLLQEVRPDAA